MPSKDQPKSVETDASVDDFIEGVADEARRADCRTLVELMGKATRAAPRMWGASMIGFGNLHMTYASGREVDWFLVGFSPRKGDLSLYLPTGFPERAGMLGRLGKHRTGAACVYVKRLADIDIKVLRELVKVGVAHARKHGGCGT